MEEVSVSENNYSYENRKTKIIIIGAGGYLGSYLLEELNKIDTEYSVYGFDHKNGKEERGENVDVCEADVVIYLAGLSGRVKCMTSISTFQENVFDIMRVANHMKKDALLVFASTASLYEGYGTQTPTETDFLNVSLYDEYTYSMYLREQNIKTLTHIHTVGLRLGTVIGLSPVQRRDLVHFSLLRSAVLTGTPKIYGANQSRAVLWNKDLLEVVKKIIQKREALHGNRIYNVSSFNCSVAKIANEIASMTGCTNYFEDDGDVLKYNLGFSMNTSKIENELEISWMAKNNRILIEDLMRDLKRICWSPEYLRKCETVKCRVCKGTNMSVVYNFGNQPNANHYLVNKEAVLPEYPLQLCLCLDCWHTQIPYTIPPEQMFSDYVYLCGTSNTMRKYFADFAVKSIQEVGVERGTVLEIACNDGTLLDAYKTHGWKTYGYDPARNLWEISHKKGHDITVGFWGVDAVPEYPELDMIVAQNVCAHVPDPVAFLTKCREVMSVKTVLYIQTSQCNMIEYGQFDTAYHEHMSFFTVHSMYVATQMAGLKIEGVEKVEVHGMSYLFRIRLEGSTETDITQHPIYLYEKKIGLYDELMYYVYVEKIKGLKRWMRNKIEKYSTEMEVVGYGAAAKGMTILNTIGEIPLSYIADDSKNKQGFYATNHNYLIASPEKLAEREGALCVVVFAWNFIQEIMEKTKALRKGKETYFVVPYPKKKIIHMNEEGEVHIVFEEIDTRYNENSLQHKTILFSHFYNEEFLLTQWIRHHASLFDCAVLINHKSTDNSVEIIRREAPTTWNVVDTWLPEFCAVNTDNEVSGYENSFDNDHWRLALTTTEFLFTTGLRQKDNALFSNLVGHEAIQISSVSLIDHDQTRANTSMSLLQQKNGYFFKKDNHLESVDERYLNNHYKRFMHKIRNMSNPYWLGRHNFRYPAIPKNLYILKYLYSPYPEFFSRKLQIRSKMAMSNVREKWGFQHMMEFNDMVEKYDALKTKPRALVSDMRDQIHFFDKYMKQNGGWEHDQLLCGIFDNLYDK